MSGKMCAAAVLLCLSMQPAWSRNLPPLWGYGVQSCDTYVRARTGWEAGVDLQIAEYRRFQDWLGGFVSALNLSTGADVLAGADIDGAMRRIHGYCDEHRKADFFTASMALLRGLSTLR